MKNLRKLLFFLLFIIYLTGVLIGGVRAVYAPNQAEMYEYLENGIKAYNTEISSGIKSALTENVKIFALLLMGGLIKPLVWLLGAAMLIKGYFAGFSIMAVLRLYGIKGCILCVSGLLSAAILIPAACYYGAINAKGLLAGEEKCEYYRKLFISTIFLAAIFCADAVIKGAMSPIFIKWASELLKLR